MAEINLEENSKNDPYVNVYSDLRKHGLCKICSYRYLCNSKFQLSLDEYLVNEGFEKNASPVSKMVKENNCVVCLGLFEDRIVENLKTRIAEETASFDCDSYMLALVLPISTKFREHSTFLYLKSQFPDLYKDCSHAPHLGLKETWRFFAGSVISRAISKNLDSNSRLIAQVTFSYVGDCEDYCKIAKICNGKMNLDRFLKSIDDSDFIKLYPFPLEVPNTCACITSIDVKRDSIFFAGRYNKFSRELSQTPWILPNGERKCESSVEEIISTKLKSMMKAEDSKFSSSGREDVDVRTLGTGRPFAVELINPQISNASFKDVRMVENDINRDGRGLIFVRHLQIVPRSDLRSLKDGEEHKTKNYNCICIMKRICDIEDLKKLLPSPPFDVLQKTPLRVLHRRSLASRKKTIHELSLEGVNVPSPEGYTIFKIDIRTEAGTYIKEFVQGDFGRTQPNLSTILGDVPIDVLALDVTNVEVDWPPEVNYENELLE